MANKPYDNEVLATKLDDFYLTKMNADQFMVINNELTANEGDTYKVRTYTATGDVEDLAMTEGNTQSIETGYKVDKYTVKKTQGRFIYYDEEVDKDPKVVETGVAKLAAQLVNNKTTNFLAALDRTPFTYTTDKFDFDAFVDAVATLNKEDDEITYALCSVADRAEIRKNLKDELKYVEDYVRTGYIGTVAGIPLYVSNALTTGTIYLATAEAVTCFNKRGTEVEQERDANTRKNTVYGRVTRVIALTDATKAVKLLKGEVPVTPSVTLDKDTATVVEGESIQLIAATVPAGETVTWTSSAEAKATVEGGVVTGVDAGEATITASITVDGDTYTDTCTVTVTEAQQ